MKTRALFISFVLLLSSVSGLTVYLTKTPSENFPDYFASRVSSPPERLFSDPNPGKPNTWTKKFSETMRAAQNQKNNWNLFVVTDDRGRQIPVSYWVHGYGKGLVSEYVEKDAFLYGPRYARYGEIPFDVAEYYLTNYWDSIGYLSNVYLSLPSKPSSKEENEFAAAILELAKDNVYFIRPTSSGLRVFPYDQKLFSYREHGDFYSGDTGGFILSVWGDENYRCYLPFQKQGKTIVVTPRELSDNLLRKIGFSSKQICTFVPGNPPRHVVNTIQAKKQLSAAYPGGYESFTLCSNKNSCKLYAYQPGFTDMVPIESYDVSGKTLVHEKSKPIALASLLFPSTIVKRDSPKKIAS